jgi:Flp pilus assembly pilin Flp
MQILIRFMFDESGQDILEYALLVGLVALVTIPTFNALSAALKVTYLSWNAGILKCWQMPAPDAGGGC